MASKQKSSINFVIRKDPRSQSFAHILIKLLEALQHYLGNHVFCLNIKVMIFLRLFSQLIELSWMSVIKLKLYIGLLRGAPVLAEMISSFQIIVIKILIAYAMVLSVLVKMLKCSHMENMILIVYTRGFWIVKNFKF